MAGFCVRLTQDMPNRVGALVSSHLGKFIGVGGLVVLGSGGGACIPAYENVRAIRAYAHEDVSLKVSLDRIEDIARTLDLVDRILVSTGYTPGDQWVRRIPLTDPDYRRIKDDIKTENPYKFGEFEVPVLKCYRRHIENVLEEYKPPPEKPMYPSIFDAVAGFSGRTPDLKKHWDAHRDANTLFSEAFEAEKQLEDELAGQPEGVRKARAGELAERRNKRIAAEGQVAGAKAALQQDAALLAADAKLSDPQKSQIARDALGVISVAFRVELEALALLPIVVIQTIRALPGAPKELVTKPTLKMVRQVYQLPSFLSGLKERFIRQVSVLEAMTGVLAKASGVDPDKTAGFMLRESVVDQIVGITLDSLRIDLKAGGEMFIFSSIPTSTTQTTKNDNDGTSETLDYTGRKFKLDYRVKPIILAQASFAIVLDWIRLPGVAALNFGYATDRAYRSGGTIEQSSLATQLGIRGWASDVFDFGLGFLGIRSSAKIAKFTSGEVRKVGAVDGAINSIAPLQIEMTQIDVGYDVLFAVGDATMKAYMEELVVGVRYYRYELPRIVYELKNTSTDPKNKYFSFNRESPPQAVDARYLLAGVSMRFGQGEAPLFSPWLDVAIFGGAGPTSFYFLNDQAGPDVASNRQEIKQIALSFNGTLAGGIRWRLLPRGSRLRLDLRAMYRADFIYTNIHRNSADLRTDYGSIDVFHGPTLAIRGAL